MDDLAGLDWSKGTSSQKPTNANYNLNTSFSGLKPTPPVSGRATPLNNVPSNPPSKPATPANDSFANLVSWSSSPSNTNLSLQEQQKRLADQKLQQQTKQAKSAQDQYGGGDDAFWNALGSGRSTPAPESQKKGRPTEVTQDEDDIFAAFNAPANGKPAPQSKPTETKPSAPSQNSKIPEDDDDPFGLSEFQQKEMRRAQTASTMAEDDDDVLGLLGKPVDPSRPRPDLDEDKPTRVSDDAHPQDRAVAELVNMGFPVEKARRALETTDSGIDVQAAVSYLLNSAHNEAKERSQSRYPGNNGHPERALRRGPKERSEHTSRRHVEDNEGSARQRRTQEQAEKDPSQMAAEFGSNFLKTANSFWKQSTKKMQQAVQEFNSDSDTGSQPKWMRDAERSNNSQPPADGGAARRRRRSSAGKRKEQDVTDEAMMLEGQRPNPPPRAQRRPDPKFDSSVDSSRDHSPVVPSRLREAASPQPAFMRQQQAKPAPQQAPSRATLNRQANEDQAAQAYVSSARRRRPAAPATAAAASEPDLFAAPSQADPPQRPVSSRPAQPPAKAAPIATRPPPPKRDIPAIPPMSLKASHSAREAGNAHFKRGDYSSAHDSYATSLKHLPTGHPLTLVLFTNHALTALKVGEPKVALADCETAISLIGISKGEAETLDFQDGTPAKPMRDYYGKALMRKAEALEQMEKWTDAALVWKEAVEAGHGGATSMQGRLRAEKAANPGPKPKPKPKAAVPTKPRPRPSAAVSSGDSAAVSRLRAANKAADQADDEKFALADSVDARLTAWRNGKQDNLRALLGSLDTVLWEGAGWKKISMADLVLPQKVKVQYMKGIGKVHPDKIPTDATTEQRMISAAVFSTLNEAWDKFKAENGL